MTIPCNWLDEQPDFNKEVMYDGKKIATIRALNRRDYGTIKQAANRQFELKGKDRILFHVNSEEEALVKMELSLTGNGAGWEFDRKINKDNLAKLPRHYFNAILGAIQDLEEKNQLNEEILGNLEEQSG